MTETSHDRFLQEMNERLSHFRSAPSTPKGRLALQRFEQGILRMRGLLNQTRGEQPDPQSGRSAPRAPATAALIGEDELF